jgi:hypothetical protein
MNQNVVTSYHTKIMNSPIFLIVTHCSSETAGRIGRIYRLLLLGKKLRQHKNK